MSTAAPRATRLAWLWCVAYTALVPLEQRARRRDEIRSHLWESAHAGSGAWRTLHATAAGMTDDLSWAASALGHRVFSSFRRPMPSLALAVWFPIQAAFLWQMWPVSEPTVDNIASAAAAAFLIGAGVAAVIPRRRRN